MCRRELADRISREWKQRVELSEAFITQGLLASEINTNSQRITLIPIDTRPEHLLKNTAEGTLSWHNSGSAQLVHLPNDVENFLRNALCVDHGSLSFGQPDAASVTELSMPSETSTSWNAFCWCPDSMS